MLEPSSYAGTNRYRGALSDLLRQLRPSASFSDADDLLLTLRAVLTSHELTRLRLACRVAHDAFRAGAASAVPAATERQVVGTFRAALEAAALAEQTAIQRAGGFVFCMSGPEAAHAYRSYARTGGRQIRDEDLVMVHCNSFVDGLWTDITRTFHYGPIDDGVRDLFLAVLAARQAALDTIAPGVPARDVDDGARQVLAKRGLADAFRHGTGHGVGFAAIDYNARPRIHPVSDDLLETGMVFNVEPAVYLEGVGGLRQCDLVAVTREGVEVLTPFQTELEELAPRLAATR